MRPLRPKTEREIILNTPILNSSYTTHQSLGKAVFRVSKTHKRRSRRNTLFQRFCPIFHRQAKDKFLLLPGNQHRLQVALLQVLSRTRRWLFLFWNVSISVIANQVGEIQFIVGKTKMVRRCISQNTTCYGALKKLLTCLTMNMISILPTTIYRNCSILKSTCFYLVKPLKMMIVGVKNVKTVNCY